MSEELLHVGVEPGLLAYSRLPTPVQGALLSPPLSRASSPLPLHLSVNTDVRVVTPLPSPVARQVGKKTSAFFSSPFDRDTPSPPPSMKHPEPERAQTANSAFSFARGSTTPTPPPSIHSPVEDPPSSHCLPPRLPPLSRFFPSRASAIDPDSPDSIGKLSSSPPSVQREFVTIDDLPSFSSSPTDLVTPDSPTPKSEAPPPAEPPPPSQSQLHQPLHRETVIPDMIALTQGTEVGTDVPLQLVRELGQGAFSCVWLALDVEHKLEQPGTTSSRLKSKSMARKKGDRSMHGLRPPLPASAPGSPLTRSQSVYFAARDGEGATSSGEADALAAGGERDHDRVDGESLVAVKMMDRAVCDANDRTRISFVREVEVLRHISHPSIVSYLHSFTTPSHHCLVLEALQGGELFELLDEGDNHSRMTEPLLRRMFGELCQAVGWMHGVGLVHRDLKLENILLTANPFLTPSPITLSTLPSPLIKLTDFGLARFIDPADPLLVTRCGSESYAAPEIVTGRPYDGRQTDAWACGIVLYALATRTLPFDRVSTTGRGAGGRGGGGGGSDRDTRRGHLMRIAQGEYVWPEEEEAARLATEGLKAVVGKLLVRDPGKRARVVEVWDEAWMRGEGAPTPPLSKAGLGGSGAIEADVGDAPAGRLVGEDIPSVAKQELL